MIVGAMEVWFESMFNNLQGHINSRSDRDNIIMEGKIGRLEILPILASYGQTYLLTEQRVLRLEISVKRVNSESVLLSTRLPVRQSHEGNIDCKIIILTSLYCVTLPEPVAQLGSCSAQRPDIRPCI